MATLNGAPVTVTQVERLALVNYGHFTSLQVEDGIVRGLSMHLDRLSTDCRAVFGVDLDGELVRECMRGLIRETGRRTLGMRLTVFDPDLDIGRPSEQGQPHILASIRPETPDRLPPLLVQSVRYLRDLPAVKHVGLFGSLELRRRAQLNGFTDALFVDSDGFISEGPTWNVGFIRDGEVIWPSADVLPGITMRLIQQVHPGTSKPVNLSELPGMTTSFATNVTVGVRPLTRIDDLVFKDNPGLGVLAQEFLAIPGEEI
jgi:branched-subunit amino acid aminotransferase/4-amino-4-deoxychorismate lyase